jgi:broad specificity phosphatase PhoE
LHALLRVALSGPESEAPKVRFVPASVTRLVFESDRARLLTLNEVPPG